MLPYLATNSFQTIACIILLVFTCAILCLWNISPHLPLLIRLLFIMRARLKYTTSVGPHTLPLPRLHTINTISCDPRIPIPAVIHSCPNTSFPHQAQLWPLAGILSSSGFPKGNLKPLNKQVFFCIALLLNFLVWADSCSICQILLKHPSFQPPNHLLFLPYNLDLMISSTSQARTLVSHSKNNLDSLP